MTKVLIASPCHRGDINIECCRAIANLCGVLGSKGIGYEWFTLLEESLVTRARNAIVAYFLSGGFTHLLFVDSDIVFDPDSVLRFLEKDLPIMAGAYPKKGIDIKKMVHSTIDTVDWDKVGQLMSNGVAGKDISEHLKKEISHVRMYLKSLTYVVRFEEGAKIEEDKWMKALDVGSGFLMIKRLVFDGLIHQYPHLKYKNDCSQYDQLHEDMKDNFYLFFDTMVLDNRYLSEDYAFCHLARGTGFDIWVDTSCGLNHIGTYVYKGHLMSSLQ
jgi:hypothetical protein